MATGPEGAGVRGGADSRTGAQPRIGSGAGPKLVRSGRTRSMLSEPTRDLRTSMLRREADAILCRAGRLPAEDRALLEMIFRDGRSAASVARMMSVPGKRVRARVRRLLARIDSPLFQYVIANAERWPDDQRLVAVALFVEGRSIRGAACHLGTSYYTVRRLGTEVRAALLAYQGAQQGAQRVPRLGIGAQGIGAEVAA